MELGHLKHFYYVAKYGGFTKASKKLFVQQPAISKSVSTLEDNLGVKLLVREKRRVFLTDIGQEIYEKCNTIFKEVDEIQLLSQEGKFSCKGPLKFCASEPISSSFIPKALKSFLTEYFEVLPACYSGFATDLTNKIEDGEFEFGLFFHTPKINEKLVVTEIGKISFDLVVKSSEIKNHNVVKSFIGSREIDDDQTKIFPVIKKMSKDYKNVEIKISSNNLTSHRNMVLEGLGVSILPTVMVEEDIRTRKLKRLYPKGTFEFGLKVVSRRNQYLSRNARAFLEVFEKSLK